MKALINTETGEVVGRGYGEFECDWLNINKKVNQRKELVLIEEDILNGLNANIKDLKMFLDEDSFKILKTELK